jgi:sugar transferase (PEP-CTERM/EpsH1 system associated)
LQLRDYLTDKAGISSKKIRVICNGVDTTKFYPVNTIDREVGPFAERGDCIVYGTVGRMYGVKDQMNLVRAFLHLLQIRPQARDSVRLALIGDGPLRETALLALQQAGAAELAWLPGERPDIPAVLRSLDVFVLPSQAEGISNSILEAMASGLPVIATAVGGNPELVLDGQTGYLVPANNPEAMAEAMAVYWEQRQLMQQHGAAGLEHTLTQFSLEGMVSRYLAVYDDSTLTKQATPCAAS